MDTRETTLTRLQHLEALYQQGYQSEVVDRSLDKIIALERASAERELADLQARLAMFEAQFHMPSDEFYRRFEAGELGDDVEFVEWSAFYDMAQAVQKRLEVLTSVQVNDSSRVP